MNKHASILLAEDDDNDVFFFKRALSKTELDLAVHVAANGEQAIDYLSGKDQYGDRATYPLPCCIFLDLKLPFLSGFEVLEWLRSQPNLRDLKVAVLTSSPEERDRQKAAELGVEKYFVKPPTPKMIVEAIEAGQ